MTEKDKAPEKELTWSERAEQWKKQALEIKEKAGKITDIVLSSDEKPGDKKSGAPKERSWMELSDSVLGKYDKIKEVVVGPPAYRSPFPPTIDRFIDDKYERPMVETYRSARDGTKYYYHKAVDTCSWAWDSTWNFGRDTIEWAKNKAKELTGYGEPASPAAEPKTSFVPEPEKPVIKPIGNLELPSMKLIADKGISPTGIVLGKNTAALTV